MNKLKQLSASKQVLFTFVTLCALLLIIGGLFFLSLLSIERNNRGQFRAMNKLAEIDDASQDVERMQTAVLRQLLASDIGDIKRLDQTVRNIWNTNVNDLDDYHKFVDTEKEKQLYSRVMQTRKEYWEQTQPVLTFGLSNQDDKAVELIISKQSPAYDGYLKAINELTDYVETDADKTADATSRFISTIKIISNVLIGMAILIAIGTGFAVVKVTRRLKQDNKVLQTEIKERKQTEEELKWKTAFLEAQVNSSIDGILVVDAQGKQILQSQRFTDLLKIPRHIADDKDDGQQVRWVTDTTKNPEQFVEKVTYLYSHPNEISRDEVEFKDGTTLDRYSSPVVGKDGKYYGRIWTFRDITERKRIEDLLRESEERFSGAFQHAPIGVALVSPAGRWIKVNRALCDLVGYSEAELLVRSFQGITHPENLEVSKENVRQLNAGEIHSFQTEKRYIHKLGHFVTVLLNVSLVRDGQGRPLYMIAQIQDITERKRTEEALNEAQALYHSLVEQMPAGVFRKDAAGRFVFMNSWYCRIKGIKPDQILGKTPQELATSEFVNHPEAAKEIQLAIQGADNHKWIMETGGRIDVEEQYPDADGKIQFWQVVKSPVFDSGGKIMGTQGIFFDITERKRAEAALAQERNLLRTMIDNSPDAIYIKDLSGRKTLVNPAELKNMGCKTEAEAIGKNDFEIYPQDLAAEYFANDQAVIQTGQPLINHEEKVITPDGKTCWSLSSKIPLRDATGLIIGLVGMGRDITERIKAEESLRLLGSAVDQTKESILITDAELDLPGPKIIFVNPAFTKMTGYTEADAVGKTPRILQGSRTDRTVLNRLRENLEHGKLFEGETINYRKDGTEFNLEWQIAPLRNTSGKITHFVAIQHDITERKRLEAQLFQSQKLETVGKLAGGFAHEFNSILTAIIGQSELLLGDLPAGNPLVKNATEINKAAGRAAALTRQLLAYGRKQFLQPEVLDLNQVIAGMKSMFHHLLGGDVDTQIITAADLHAVKADAGQIEQVIVNMTINARDAMPNGGKFIMETANVPFDRESIGRYPELKQGDYVMLAITDTGTGMNDTVRARVFEPFFSTKGVGQGTGLGLSTCYGIVKQSGGHISVYSELGRGTTFKIYLPQVEQQAKISIQRLDSPDLPSGTETILLVEDDPALREMAATLLRRLGYTVLTAANGVEALSVKHERGTGHIDLLFTDVVMPHMSGKELADRVRALYPHTRILFTSAYTENAIVHQGVLDKGVALLQKPFTPSALANKIREVLD